MEVIFARTRFPDRAEKVLFLAGPTPRDASAVSWRWEALKLLKEKLLFDGTVFVPEDQNGGMSGGYDEQVEWERRALHRSDVVVFWVPRNMKTMPGLTTNDEVKKKKKKDERAFCNSVALSSLELSKVVLASFLELLMMQRRCDIRNRTAQSSIFPALTICMRLWLKPCD